MFAILKTGGKQYKVAKEEKLLIEKIDGNIGDEVVFNDIIMINDNGKTDEISNPNGSIKNIAGIFNKEKNVLGMMPHPERMIDESLSGEDGSIFFKNLINNIK